MLTDKEVEQKTLEYKKSLQEQQRKEQSEAFIAHLEEAGRIVSTWPAWKRNLLGRLSHE